MTESNSEKAKAGKEWDKIVRSEIEKLVDDEIISSFETKVNFCHSGFRYKHQYLANFVIKTLDDKYIVVRRSKSFKGDRSKIGLYDLEGINKNSEFSKEIVASIYLVPDIQLSTSDFINARKRITNNEMYFPASHLLTISEFIAFLNEYKIETLNCIEEEKLDTQSIKEKGSYYGVRGNQFELIVTDELSNKKNLRLIKESNASEIYSIIIGKILYDHQVKIQHVISINATNTIPKLNSGGSPKTDVAIIIESVSHPRITETISIKNSGQRLVTCHDYKAQDFVRVLQCEHSGLSQYLELFQKHPKLGQFEKQLPNTMSVNDFAKLIRLKRDLLVEWVLTGKHDKQNLVKPEIQISNYLLIKHINNIKFFSMNEYIDILNDHPERNFGSPFSWTYPSKQEGNRIQLKLPIIGFQ